MGCSPQEGQVFSFSHKPEPTWVLASLASQPSAVGKIPDWHLQPHPLDTPPGACSSVLIAKPSKWFCLHHELWVWVLWRQLRPHCLGQRHQWSPESKRA